MECVGNHFIVTTLLLMATQECPSTESIIFGRIQKLQHKNYTSCAMSSDLLARTCALTLPPLKEPEWNNSFKCCLI